MELQLLIISLTFAAVTANPLLIQPRVTESDQTAYRLSGLILPSTYDVHLLFYNTTFSEGSTFFQGDVLVTFTVKEPIDVVDIHAPSVPTTVEIGMADNETKITNVAAFNGTSHILRIALLEWLQPEITYEVRIEYNATLDPTYMSGAYLSYYKKDGADKIMVTTQFQPDSARKAFPCFDEPEFKAVFRFTISYPAELTALFNTDPATTTSIEGYSSTIFEPTPIMSTYLIAFVISEFTCNGSAEIEEGIPHRICSRNETFNDREYANEWGPQVMNAIEALTNVSYSRANITKMDQIAIPDFSAGAMENWGLVTYREMALLYNKEESAASNRQTIVTIIAHEFAHMWFGNLVTTKWWNTLFLNEGFATYYEYFGPASIDELEINQKWELSKQFIVNEQQSVLVSDGSISSSALSSQASSPSQIWGKFSSISYTKGASIIRMVRNFLGEENFRNGINNYLTQNEFKAVQPWNLWEALQVHAPVGVLPTGLTLEDVMANWVNESGYPVVTVNVSGDDVYLSQKRFLYSGESNTQWYVPISYTTAEENTTGFDDLSPKNWLHPGNYILRLPNVVPNDSWIILNNQESAYYRVNYDETLWERIREVLYENHTQIDVLNRAQIVDDAINLARAGLLPYAKAFSILGYLKNETEYYPLYSALTGLDFLTRTFGETSEVAAEINKLQLEILEAVKGELTWNLTDTTPHIDVRRATMVLGRLCKLEEPTCIEEAKRIFAAFRENTRFDNNLKTVVFCNALRHSENEEDDWQFLWERFASTEVASEQVLLLSVLGCTKNETLLTRYLEHSLNETGHVRHQDISRVWSSIITSNHEGILTAINFYKDNHPRIIARFSESISVLVTAAARATTPQHIEALEEIIALEDLLDDVKQIAESAVLYAQANVNWAAAREDEMRQHFGIGQQTTTPSFSTRHSSVVWISLILVLTTIFMSW